jgi:outer membrane protein TolC
VEKLLTHINRIIILLITAGFLLVPNIVRATTLEEAIDYAEGNSNNIKLADYKLAATKTLKMEAISGFLPNIRANLRYGERKDNVSLSDKTFNNEGSEEIKVEQSLFDGMRSVSKYQEADYKIKSANSENKDKRQEVALNVANAYLELYRYQEILKLQKANLEFAEKIFALAKRRKEERIINESDIIKFNYETSIVKEKYLNAVSKFSKAQFDYQNVVGRLDSNLTKPETKENLFTAEQVISEAMANNSNLQSHHYNYLASKATYSAEKSKLLPSVSVVGAITRQKNVDYLGGRDLNSKSISLNVSIPIFQQGVEYASIIKTKNQSLIALKEYEINKDTVIKDVSKALEEYNYFLKLNQSNQQLVTLAQNRYKIINQRFNAGIEDPIDLIRSKLEIKDRQIDYINSQVDLIINRYKIRYYLGEK